MILLVSPRQIKYNKLCYAYILKNTREDLLIGKQSTRENKTIYQICREEAGLTRAEASEKMTAVSDSKIEKFEYEMQEPAPYDIVQMGGRLSPPGSLQLLLLAQMRNRPALRSGSGGIGSPRHHSRNHRQPERNQSAHLTPDPDRTRRENQ